MYKVKKSGKNSFLIAGQSFILPIKSTSPNNIFVIDISRI